MRRQLDTGGNALEDDAGTDVTANIEPITAGRQPWRCDNRIISECAEHTINDESAHHQPNSQIAAATASVNATTAET